MKMFRFISTVMTAMLMHAASAAENSSVSNQWITLGTMGGPIPNPTHSQPANALLVGSSAYIVDAGDGAAGQLVTAGHSLRDVRAVFISHLHFDHTAGLAAIIALRWQANVPGKLAIYGPPGIKQTVAGIFSYMDYAAQGHYGVPGQKSMPVDNNVEVIEIADGTVLKLEDFTVTAVRNSHYSWPQGSKEWEKFQALSFKFELPNRTIVYTGDTGPSTAVVELAKDADLFVSEMMDIDYIIAEIKRTSPNMPAVALKNIEKHLRHHHITPEQVGDMADQAGVKQVVVTHMAPGEDDPAKVAAYTERVKSKFSGEVVMAKDLDRF
ncbi:MBL fold metallo-hydrolase [Arenicella xantha]|uniref:Ribonuclease BN (tRNA processing enzyme) n=1 Tax=Arenicella xantha TaxID=644221 RepID=A0A395JES6_9GAMM|nr:MBL fold metallo-hydrolase [Arenicella xantha]RBP47183.1 ribonuclease BN (tRNA processing enzyme) [Arenicella xantha]